MQYLARHKVNNYLLSEFVVSSASALQIYVPVVYREYIIISPVIFCDPLQCSCLKNAGIGEPGGLPSMGSHRVGHDWSDLAAAAAAYSVVRFLCSLLTSRISYLVHMWFPSLFHFYHLKNRIGGGEWFFSLISVLLWAVFAKRGSPDPLKFIC